MRAIWTTIRAILALAVLVALTVAVGYGFRVFVHWIFKGVDPSVAAAIVAAFATAVASVAGIFLGRFNERRKAIDDEIRARKIPIYTELTAGILKTLSSASSQSGTQTQPGTQRQPGSSARRGQAAQQALAQTQSTTEFAELLERLTPQLITWASDEVLIAWSRFKRIAASSPDSLAEFEKLLAAIRKDFGHRNRNVGEGDLLGLFITDVDVYLAQRRAGTS